MTVIFSDRAVDGCVGVYFNPKFYDGIPSGATCVITKNEKIKAEAKAKGIPVEDFPKQPPTGKEEKKTTPPVKKEKKVEIVTESNTEPPLIVGLTDVVTTFEEDIKAGMSVEDLMGKHGVTKRKITMAKKKLLK